MSALVTVERYRVITGDTATASGAVSAAIEDATSLLGEALGRPGAVKSEERTETMQVGPTGQLRPLAVPVTVCAGYDFDTAQIYGASPDSAPFRGVTSDELPRTVAVTYTGGWVERSANPSAANALPSSVERAIANAAKGLLDATTASEYPAGATSVSVGDVSISFGAAGAPGEVDVVWPRAVLKWKRRL